MAEGVLLLTYKSVSITVSSPMSDPSVRGMNIDMHVDHVSDVTLNSAALKTLAALYIYI